MTCFLHCSLVTLEWDHNTSHVHTADIFDVTTFSVADPKMDPDFFLYNNFVLHAKQLFATISLYNSLYDIPFKILL